MDLDFSEEHEMLRQSAREFLNKEFPKTRVRAMEDSPTGFDIDVWKKMAGLGWMGLVVPETYGGSGCGLIDLVVLLEEMGRACLVGPFFSTAISTLPILEAGNEDLRKEFLPKLAKGEVILTLAITEPSASYEAVALSTRAMVDGNWYVLDGTKLFVSDAEVAHYFLTPARTEECPSPEEGISLLLVETRSDGVKISPLLTISNEKQSEIILDKVRVPKSHVVGNVNGGWPLVKRLQEQAAVGKCAEMLGGLGWVLENCVAYAKERVQYGKPIGSFQAIQHQLAEMWTEIEIAKRLVYQAAWSIEEGISYTPQNVAMAKAWTSQIYLHWTKVGVQIFGAIGTTREHDVGLYYRRARQAAPLFGDMVFCRETVAQELGL